MSSKRPSSPVGGSANGVSPKRARIDDQEEEMDPMSALESATAGIEGGVITVGDDYSVEESREIKQSKVGFGGGDAGPSTAAGSSGEDKGTEDSKAGPSTTTNAGIKLTHQVRHKVSIPPNYDYKPISSHVYNDPPARVYPFTLDPFQKLSVASIERSESVLVSAHTSAGKTVVAEYCIAQALARGQRVVYTSPIKALSNQKYRELLAEFGDVGLMTGDVTINPNAGCLVMTTEILRSMIYRGGELVRELGWVVFDEVHYMRDKERGVIWEETIILLPSTVHYVFLSATIPNSLQFAEWITSLHNQPCHVVYTDFRPTPLQHYLFPQGGEGIWLVVDEKGQFREDNFVKGMGGLEGTGEDPAVPHSGKGRKGKTRKGGAMKGGVSDIYKIVKMIMLKALNPVIVFAFSKRECEGLAMQMSKLEFNTDDERDLVESVFTNAISGLSDDDKELPQIQSLLPLLKRGIGIHHGGLLPILKEVIEILFQEGLLKVLFATETFSIGLNMPAKTVVFNNVRKFDGKDFRPLSSGEYIQMSGRAGRRGLDERGIVVMMVDEKLEPEDAKNMVKGEADRLDSAFHLGYNMILNLMRVEGVSPEFILEKCFFQFQSSASVPMLEEELREAETSKAAMIIPQEGLIAEYYERKKQVEELGRDFKAVITHPTYSLPFLQAGRLVYVKHGDSDYGWGVVLNYTKKNIAKGKGAPPIEVDTTPQAQYIVDVLLNCGPGSTVSTKDRSSAPTTIRPCPPGEKGEPLVVPVLLSTIEKIAHIRIFMPKDLRSLESRQSIAKAVEEVKRRFPEGITLLDPVKNMGIKDEDFLTLIKKIKKLDDLLLASPLHNSPELPSLYASYSAKIEATAAIRALKKKITAVHNVLQLDELKCRKRVLRRLGFTTSEDVIEMKGRVACEISTGDELLLTEMIFGGVFNTLEPEHCAALLSCFVFQEKSTQVVKLKEELAGPLRIMQENARRIAKVSIESKLPLVEEEYVQSFKVELMDAVMQWCRGAKFSEVCKMTDVFEGSLIRAFRRLQELLRQMGQAAKAIGNTELEEKFEKTLEMLDRPNSVVFNPSLYL